MSCNRIANDEFSPTGGKLLAELSRLSTTYQLEFEINVNSFPNSWVSVLHMTTGSNCCGSGSRIPAFFGNGGSTPYLHSCSSINGNGNSCTNINIGTNEWIKIKVSQNANPDGSYIFQLSMDGAIVWSVLNNQAVDFENVKLFASDPWYPSFDGKLRNLVTCSKGK